MAGPFDARSIANRILDHAEHQGLHLTVMQLLKLVYLAHGWWLTFSGGNPLTTIRPEAWKYGPVHRDVYNSFRHFGSNPIVGRAVDSATGFEYREQVSDDIDQLLAQVVSSYGKHHAFTLSDIMHKPGTPWSVTSETRGHYAPIEDDLIREHFDDIRQQRPAG